MKKSACKPSLPLFLQCPSTVFFCKEITKEAKYIFPLVMGLCNNDKNYCWASNAYLSEKLEYSNEKGELKRPSERSVRRWLGELEDKGFITIILIGTAKGTERRIYLTDKIINTSIPQGAIKAKELPDLEAKVQGNPPDKFGHPPGQMCPPPPDKFGHIIKKNNKIEKRREKGEISLFDNLENTPPDSASPPPIIPVEAYLQKWDEAFPGKPHKAGQMLRYTWENLEVDIKQEILLILPSYFNSAERRFLKNPYTYIVDETYLQPIVNRKTKKKTTIKDDLQRRAKEVAREISPEEYNNLARLSGF